VTGYLQGPAQTRPRVDRETEAELLERHLGAGSSLVGEPAFASAFTEGTAMSFDDAIAFALEVLRDA
jgi:hypothetical protein